MKHSLILVVIAGVVLAGCAGGAPKCDNKQAISKVEAEMRKGAKDVFALMVGPEQAGKVMDAIRFEFSNIRSNTVDDKAKNATCTADFKMSTSDGSKADDAGSVNYRVSEGTDGLVVTVTD